MPALTRAQETYHEAFDRFLSADRFEDRWDARDDMAECLNFLLAEKGLPLPDGTRWPSRSVLEDPDGRLTF